MSDADEEDGCAKGEREPKSGSLKKLRRCVTVAGARASALLGTQSWDTAERRRALLLLFLEALRSVGREVAMVDEEGVVGKKGCAKLAKWRQRFCSMT